MRTHLRRPLLTMASAMAGLSLLAFAPQTSDPAEGEPGYVDHRVTLASGDAASWDAPTDTGSVNYWAHSSIWDGNTCYSGSADNKCDRILVRADDKGAVTVTMTPNNEYMDFDLLVYNASSSGEAFGVVAHEQNQMMIADTGPYPLPGAETVTFDAKADKYYLAVVFYRAGGGGYVLDAAMD